MAKADIHFGFFTVGAEHMGPEVAAVEALVGAPGIQQSMWALSIQPSLSDLQLDQMIAANRTPMVQAGPGNLHPASMDVIDAVNLGYYDAAVRHYANLAKLVAPDIVLLRCMHEQNCCYGWYTSGCDATKGAKYVSAFRRIYSLVHEVTNNMLVGWCPNVEYLGTDCNYRFDTTNPGTDWMDWVGLDGYWAASASQGWEVYDYTITHMNDLGLLAKPIIVAEWGVHEFGGTGKSALVTNILDNWFPNNIPNLLGIVSQNDIDGGSDWRFNSSANALAAYQAGLVGYNRNKLTAADFDLSNLGGSGGSGGTGGTGETGTGGGTGGSTGGETPPVVVHEVLQGQISLRLGGYDAVWTNPDLIEEYLQNGLGLREQDIRVIMQNIQRLAKTHWHYNPAEEPGTGGYVENARSWHASRFYNPLGWNQ